MQLFVLGMHRSGTSAVTRLLNLAGAYFGPEGISNGADEGNLKGFWERRDIRDICDGLLRESGHDWWRVGSFTLDNITDEVRERHLGRLRKLLLEIDAHRPWVVKEPRLSLLFPLVRPLLEVPVCIHVAREPLEVAESLHTRNGFAAPTGIALWEMYTIHAFQGSADVPRLLVHYEDLVSSPVPTVAKLIGQLDDCGVSGLHVPTEREITAYISPDLHRARRSPEGRHSWMNDQQVRLAAAVDDGSVVGGAVPAEVSLGGRAVLRAFEEDRLRQDHLEHDLAAESQRRRRIHQVADDALSSAELNVRAYSRSRTARFAWRIASLRRFATPGTSMAAPPLVRVLDDIEQSRRELDQTDSDAKEPPPASLHTATSSEPSGHLSVSTPGSAANLASTALVEDVEAAQRQGRTLRPDHATGLP
jgi:hypothetical protein